MDKLEEYLDQVCRGIAGPRAMRQHVRQELREHLKDSIADHVATGMTQEQALDRALDDFGGPADVRAELEATHGHRMLAVVIDKAMQWKENTMKSRLMWNVWAHLALLIVIALELAFVCGVMIFILPKFEQMAQDGLLGEGLDMMGGWFKNTIGLARFFANDGWWVYGPLVVLWVLFEWRVRGEQKSFTRLAALGTIAILLLAMVMVTAAVIILPAVVGVDSLNRRQLEPVVSAQLSTIDRAITGLNRALATNNHGEIAQAASKAHHVLGDLSRMGPAAPTMVAMQRQAEVDELRKLLSSAKESLDNVRDAACVHDGEREAAEIAAFREAYAKIKNAASTRPATQSTR